MLIPNNSKHARRIMNTVVRVVLYNDDDFEAQWNDQVQGDRKNDWREFVKNKVENMREITPVTEHPITYDVVATVSLKFIIVILPGRYNNA